MIPFTRKQRQKRAILKELIQWQNIKKDGRRIAEEAHYQMLRLQELLRELDGDGKANQASP